MARYRDSQTGRFVSKSTWKRSHAQGGKRFVRETGSKIRRRVDLPAKPGSTRPKPVPRRKRKPEGTKRPSPGETRETSKVSKRALSELPIREWIIGFKYKNRRAFDVIVTARTEEQAQDVAIKFLHSDRNGRRIIESGMKNWDMRIARARETRREEGQAEYRNKRR